MRSVSLAVLAFGLALAGSASAAGLVNGDFEQPGGEVRDALTADYLPGWTYDTSAGSEDIYEADDTGDGLTAADGDHYVSFGHDGTAGGSIFQSFATVVGDTYTVTYSVGEQQGEDSDQVLRATVVNSGQTLSQDNNPLAEAFAPGAPITFVAQADTATLTFLDATADGGASSNLALDAVGVIDQTVSAAPEPSAWALMIAGLAVAGAALRLGRRVRPSPRPA